MVGEFPGTKSLISYQISDSFLAWVCDLLMCYFQGLESFPPHDPKALELGLLANLNKMVWTNGVDNLEIKKSNAGKLCVSKQQVEALCLALLAHEETFDAMCENFAELSDAPNLSAKPMRIRMSPFSSRYVGPALTPVNDLLHRSENVAVADKYCGQYDIYVLSKCNVRKGFFLGDGSGFGKTRTIALLIAEYNSRGVTSCLYLCGNSKHERASVIREVTDVLDGRVVFYQEDDRLTWEGPTRSQQKTVVVLVSYRFLSDPKNFQSVLGLLGPQPEFDGMVNNVAR